MDVTLAELAEQVGGTVCGDPDVRLTGLAGLTTAGPADLTFLRADASAASLAALAVCEAGAVVVAY